MRLLPLPVHFPLQLAGVAGAAIALDELVLLPELRLHDRTDLRDLRLRQDQTLGETIHEGIQIGLRALAVLGVDGERSEKERH